MLSPLLQTAGPLPRLPPPCRPPHTHPTQVKVKAAQKFLAKAHRVKLSLQFRGREMEFQQLGREMFMVRQEAARAV